MQCQGKRDFFIFVEKLLELVTIFKSSLSNFLIQVHVSTCP